MERFELDIGLQDEIRAGVFGADFVKLVQSVRRNGQRFKIAIRPVEIGGVRKFQAETTDNRQVQVRNFDAESLKPGLEEIIAQKGARDLHLMTVDGDLHVRVTRKGHVLVSRGATEGVANRPSSPSLSHDRVKKTPLNEFDSSALLRATGLADGDGRVKASMRGKYDQVNEFLKNVKEVLADATAEERARPFRIVDCGCGKAYLTAALYEYLTLALGFSKVEVIGVDRREDVIASAKRISKALDAVNGLKFIVSDLAAYNPEPRDGDEPSAPRAEMVVSLHACDTATDEALAKAVEWKSRHVLSAPCCQHELQKAIGGSAGSAGMTGRGAFSGLLRQGILRERLCDLLTDAFRAQIMRILGYKTQVVEFVSSEATARNIMLKGVYGIKPGQPGPVGEYLDLRDFWGVMPWLETRLGERLARHLERYATPQKVV